MSSINQNSNTKINDWGLHNIIELNKYYKKSCQNLWKCMWGYQITPLGLRTNK